ncbi:UDP-D-xylose:L-fucose alpha-1,3-D-xylosyltransferase M [Sesamum alatum]|uniref:Glycosyltransferase n=1 Tax=Sesamum alatum TaxID=300844 RepID=A0AAE1XQQ7_9LAMI|nr:UDP-D-xylose:L-fucose alpha-1,3-D-xylosyltransferase M [Sesamum alatum]
MSSILHQRSLQVPSSDPSELSPRSRQNYQKPTAALLSRGPALLLLLLSLLIIVGVIFPYLQSPISLFSFKSWSSDSKWREYTLPDAAAYVAKNNTLIVCAVSEAYLPFLNNWLISIARQKQQDKVLVIAEDYATLYKVNERWPGHAVLVPPALEAAAAHKFGSQGFFNFTARRPRHLLQILELGYNVMYNDVDMVWLADPFPYMEGEHDVYFTDDMAFVKPHNHSHGLPPPGKKGRPYICSCMIYLRPTPGAKLVMKKWIEELQAQPWSKAKKANDQPGFNWALLKTAGQVDMYLLPQTAFPTGGLYFRNKTWVKETKGMHVIIHNNYIVGFEKKIKRFRDYSLWLVDDHASESPLGNI